MDTLMVGGRGSPAEGEDLGRGPVRVLVSPPSSDEVRATGGPGVPDARAEFTAFMAEAAAPLSRTAWFLCGDEHRAEELVQQAFVRTWQHWAKARTGEPLAYARTVLTNLRIDHWRKHRREVLSAPASLPDDAVPSVANHHAERDRLRRALLTLGLQQRRIVVLRYLEGLPELEVADALGVSVGTVKSTASRGLARLREQLGDVTGTGAMTNGRSAR